MIMGRGTQSRMGEKNKKCRGTGETEGVLRSRVKGNKDIETKTPLVKSST